MNWVQVANFFDPLEAQIIQGRLKTEGIEAKIDSSISLCNISQALVPIPVWVKPLEYQHALFILSEEAQGHFEIAENALIGLESPH